MAQFVRFWQTLLDHIVLMQLIMPSVGVLLVLASAKLGRETLRQTACTNAVLTSALALLMVLHYDPQLRTEDEAPRTLQMTSTFLWVGEIHRPSAGSAAEIAGPDIRFSVGVDGLSVWFVALINLLCPLAVVAARDIDCKHPAALYSLMLLLQMTLAGMFAARDFLLFWTFLAGSSALLFGIVGMWSCAQREATALRIGRALLAGDLLVLLGFAGLIVSQTWMVRFSLDTAHAIPVSTSLSRVLGDASGSAEGGVASIAGLTQASFSARKYWSVVGGVVLALILAGFGCRGGLLLWYRWLPMSAKSSPAAVRILVVCATLPAALYGTARFGLPLIAPGWHLHPLVLWGAIWSAAAALLGAAHAHRRGEATAGPLLPVPAAYLVLSHAGAALAGICSRNATSVCGAILLTLNTVVAAALLFASDRRFIASTSINRTPGGETPMDFALSRLAVLALLGLPGFGGFIAMLALVRGLSAASPASAALVMIAFAMNAWILLHAFQPAREIRGATGGVPHVEAPSSAEPRSLLQTPTMLACALVLILLGMIPQWAIEILAPTVSALLDK